MEIVENLAEWRDHFEANWLAHYRETGETDWKLYSRPRHKTAPGNPGLRLEESKLLFITSSGAYLKASQPAYDAENDLGDYSIRVLPMDTPFDAIAYAHTHYDHAAVEADPQVLMPLQHLRDMVDEGKIGSLTENLISFSGYQPEVDRIVNELIPEVKTAVAAEAPDAILLVPA